MCFVEGCDYVKLLYQLAFTKDEGRCCNTLLQKQVGCFKYKEGFRICWDWTCIEVNNNCAKGDGGKKLYFYQYGGVPTITISMTYAGISFHAVWKMYKNFKFRYVQFENYGIPQVRY